jgi:hypothetical protein
LVFCFIASGFENLRVGGSTQISLKKEMLKMNSKNIVLGLKFFKVFRYK